MLRYLVHCYSSNNTQYAQIVPPEAEKHFPIHFLCHITYCKEFQVKTRCVQTESIWQYLLCIARILTKTWTFKPMHTSCGLLSVKRMNYSILNSKQLFTSPPDQAHQQQNDHHNSYETVDTN